MTATVFHIGLSSWIIRDGNYGDFHRGEVTRFALEFYSEIGLSFQPRQVGLVHRRDALYTAGGTVRFAEQGVWVVDFGDAVAFREGNPPPGVVAGVKVSGELYLGIDPFFYFESHYKMPGIPALIYEWQIEDIAMETAPFIESLDASGRKVLVRDKSKLRRISTDKTDAWNDDGGNADYVLTCRRTSAAPSKSLDGRV